jgi:hypothetical protein
VDQELDQGLDKWIKDWIKLDQVDPGEPIKTDQHSDQVDPS